jgi:hypothetical protein
VGRFSSCAAISERRCQGNEHSFEQTFPYSAAAVSESAAISISIGLDAIIKPYA